MSSLVLCVMMAGTMMTPMLSANSWDTREKVRGNKT